MDTSSLVTLKRDAGRDLLRKLDEKQIGVKSAFWIYNREDDVWRLYLSTDMVNRDGPLKILAIIDEILTAQEVAGQIDLQDIVLVTPKAGLVRELRRVAPTTEGDEEIELRGSVIGGVPIDEALIYRSS